MQIQLAEFDAPLREQYGRAAWTLLHRAPYQARSFGAEELVAGEERWAQAPAVAYAWRYLGMAEAMLRAYPCGECRRRAARDRGVAEALRWLAARVGEMQPCDDPEDIADALALGAMRLHCAVTLARGPSDDDLVAQFDASLASLVSAIDRGVSPESTVASMLRLRWDRSAA
jgi:hypothetical protein